jgi:formate dehydrogenase iron-sulfur subunit
MKLTRRTFFKITGAAGAAGLAGRPTTSQAAVHDVGANMPAVLIDTTKCIGCRACEAACSEANALPAPAHAGDQAVFATRRTTDTNVYTVVNRVEGRAGGPERFVKTQCMHCVDPGCASACPARALEKTREGPVVYHGERCLGCRYCMLACPFDVPKYEYDSPTPYVRKCEFCAERQAAGLEPACTAVCPSGALQFGTRAALIDEARMRIYQNPGSYVKHIYGEHEAGGTAFLYISDRPLDEIGLNTGVPAVPASALAHGALSVVPFIMTLWPPLLMGLYTFSQRRASVAEHGDDEGTSRQASGSEDGDTRHA